MRTVEAQLIETRIVSCKKCGQQNRLYERTQKGIYRCASCQAAISNPFRYTGWLAQIRSNANRKALIAACVLLLVIGFISGGLWASYRHSSAQGKAPSAKLQESAIAPVAKSTVVSGHKTAPKAYALPALIPIDTEQFEIGPPQPIPATGYRGLLAVTGTPHFAEQPFAESELPATLKVTAPKTGAHYWIELQRINDKHSERLFVRSGETASVQVLLGTYRIKFRTGKVWRGDLNPFGSETKHFQCEGEYTFSHQGNEFFGHEFTLSEVLAQIVHQETREKRNYPQFATQPTSQPAVTTVTHEPGIIEFTNGGTIKAIHVLGANATRDKLRYMDSNGIFAIEAEKLAPRLIAQYNLRPLTTDQRKLQDRIDWNEVQPSSVAEPKASASGKGVLREGETPPARRGESQQGTDELQHLATDDRLPSGSVLVDNLRQFNGKGKLTLDNGLPDDACVKLVSGGALKAFFYVRGHTAITFDHIPDGLYKVLYCTGFGWDANRRDFQRGRHAVRYNDELTYSTRLESDATGTTTFTDVVTLTLHKVPSGNAKTSDMSLEEFDRY